MSPPKSNWARINQNKVIQKSFILFQKRCWQDDRHFISWDRQYIIQKKKKSLKLKIVGGKMSVGSGQDKNQTKSSNKIWSSCQKEYPLSS